MILQMMFNDNITDDDNDGNNDSNNVNNDKISMIMMITVGVHDNRVLQGKGQGISLSPHYYFHPLHRHLDISRAITAEGSPLHIASSRTLNWNLLFPSASR